MKSARERATERYWLACQKAFQGNPMATQVLWFVADIEAEDCDLLRRAASHTLEALSNRLASRALEPPLGC